MAFRSLALCQKQVGRDKLAKYKISMLPLSIARRFIVYIIKI